MWSQVLSLTRLEMWPGLRRGMLLRLGLAWMLLGATLPERTQHDVPGVALTYAPALVVVGWEATGAFAIYGALGRDRSDDLAWGVLTFMPSVCAISYLISGLIGLASLVIPEAEHLGYLPSLAWAGFWSLIWSIVRGGAHIIPSPTITLRSPP